MILKSFLAFLALVALAENAQVEEGSSSIPETSCLSYRWNVDQFRRCKTRRFSIYAYNYSYDASKLYAAAKEICANRETILTCMDSAVGSCSNADELTNYTANAFGFCDHDKVRSVMAWFLKINAGKEVSTTCRMAVVDEIETRFELPDFGGYVRSDLASDILRQDNYFIWYINRFREMDLDVTLVECDGMTRRQVYGIMIASLEIRLKWGRNYYVDFLDMVLQKRVY